MLESEEEAAAGMLFFWPAPQDGILAVSLARRFLSGWTIGRPC